MARLGRGFPNSYGIGRVRPHQIDSCPAGPKTAPDSVVNDAAVGDVAWSNPANAKLSDNTYATCVVVAQTSQRLNATGFAFNIDLSKQIDGIVVETEGKESVGSSTVTCRIIKGGTVSSTAKTNTWTTSEAFISYGGSTDLWGETWTPADINAANFGVSVRQESGLTATLSCDSIRITVYCSTPIPFDPALFPPSQSQIESGGYIGRIYI